MSSKPTIDSVPVAHTPPGGWTTWPDPVLAGCDEPLAPHAPDIRGLWQVVDIAVDGQPEADHRGIGLITRIEQAGDRLIVTGGGVIHDMRCDGTLDNGVNDVMEADFTTRIRVAATYEDGVHVLRPDGLPIEVRRWRDGEDLMWDYPSFVARLRRLGDPEEDPETLNRDLASDEG